MSWRWRRSSPSSRRRRRPLRPSGKDPHWQSVVDTIAELRPHIQADGGDMALLSVANHQVTVSLSGSCSGCMMTDMTLAWLQQKLWNAPAVIWKWWLA